MLLIKKDLINDTDKTALFIASEKENIGIIELLMQRILLSDGLALNFRNINSKRPIFAGDIRWINT